MNGRKILVTGANGMLGSNITDKDFLNLVKFDSAIDITDKSLLYTKLEELDIDIIIHTAAYTNVEQCELEPDKAYKVNTIGTQNLVNYCIDQDILFIYISSTGIYGSYKETAYNEFDESKPTTVHHRSKYEAEKIIQNHLSKYLIIRTGWLYGGEKTHSKNFVYKRYLEAISKDTIYSDPFQIGNPTYVKDLVEQIKVLIANKQYGLFNCVNEAQTVSRYDYVKQIIEYFNLNCDVQAASKEFFQRIAPVSTNESAVNYKLKLLDLNIMGNWKDSLQQYINELKKEI